MRTRIATLALLLLAGAAPAALAQSGGGGPAAVGAGQSGGGPAAVGPRHGEGARPAHPRGEVREGAPHPGRPPPSIAPMPPQARTPPAPPQARDVRGGGPRWGGEGGPRVVEAPRPGAVQGPRPGPGVATQRRPEDQPGGGPTRRPGTWRDVAPTERQDQQDRQELRDARRYGGRPPSGGPAVRTPEIRSFGARPPEAGSDVRRLDRGPGGVGGQDRAHDRRYRPEWRPGVYPHSFHSSHRYHARPYRHPPHYFAHVWVWGEILPSAWYTPDYLIEDWWDFDLPAPPPGYDWVRVGDDALLIDAYTGRIVQVIRGVFW